MAKCLICNLDVNSDDKNLIVTEIFCPHCGNYAYEKTFKTTFDFFLSSQNEENVKKIKKQMKKIVKKEKTCFVDDFETTSLEGYNLCELIDIINPVGIEFTHNNTIDSNYKD